MTNYSIERLSRANIQHLRSLYRSVFGRRVTPDFLLRKYDTCFTGVQFIGYFAIAPDGMPAAFYGVIPCFVRIAGRQVLAAQSADTMTHPRHRGAGLFIRLAKETYRLATANGIALVFGFPNQSSYAGFVKLDWLFLPERMKVFMVPASLIAFRKVIKKIAWLTRAHDQWLQTLYPSLKDPTGFINKNVDGIVKDEAFFTYKRYSGARFLKIDKTLIWLKADGLLKIGYVASHEIISLQSLLPKLKTLAAMSGCSHIMFVAAENTELFRELRRCVEPAGEFPIGVLPLSDRQWDFSRLSFDYCDIDTF